MVAQLTFILPLDKSGIAKEVPDLITKLKLPGLSMAAVILHLETKHFAAEQTNSILLHLGLAEPALAVVVVFHKLLVVAGQVDERKCEVRCEQ